MSGTTMLLCQSALHPRSCHGVDVYAAGLRELGGSVDALVVAQLWAGSGVEGRDQT
jgi:hypothetical protein